ILNQTILNEERFLDVDVDQSFANNVHHADDNSAKWNLSSYL
ncbi:3563_t:CDS:1, partial [Entrophospora sp. SA101]